MSCFVRILQSTANEIREYRFPPSASSGVPFTIETMMTELRSYFQRLIYDGRLL